MVRKISLSFNCLPVVNIFHLLTAINVSDKSFGNVLKTFAHFPNRSFTAESYRPESMQEAIKTRLDGFT